MSETIPDRISIEEGDPGQVPFQLLGKQRWDVRILLDGVEQRECVTADRKEGWVKRYVTDNNGRLSVRGDRIATEIVHGKVEFTF